MRARTRLAVWIITIGFAIINLLWVERYRIDQPLDIDEAGYFSFPMLAYHAFRSGGLDGWFSQIQVPNQQPPVTTALTSLFCILFGPSLFDGFLAQAVFGCLVLIATYYLAMALSRRADAALITVILVATVPILVGEVRSYHFTMAATAAATWALVCLIRSKHLSHFGWSLAFGVCLGLMPLSRTVSVSLMPGLVISAILALVVKRHSWAIRHAIVATLSALLVAASWNYQSWVLVWQYLSDFGYGTRSYEYGSTVNPLFNLAAWYNYAARLAEDFYLFHLAIVLIGVCMVIVFLVMKKKEHSDESIVTSPLFITATFLIVGVLALKSSRNVGSFFEAPLFPAGIAIGVLGWSYYLQRISFRMFGAVAIFSSLLLTVSMFRLEDANNPPREIVVAGFPLILSDPRSHIQNYEQAGGFVSGEPDLPVDLINGRRWTQLFRKVNAILVPSHRLPRATAFGFNDRLFNMNSVNLPGVIESGRQGPFLLVDAFAIGDDVGSYRRWLSIGDGLSACRLLTAVGRVAMFEPAVTQSKIVDAAKSVGFVVEETTDFPDGSGLRIWKRQANCV